MTKLTTSNPRLAEKLGGFLHDLLRAGGVTITSTEGNNRIREIGTKFANSIEHTSEFKAIQILQKLQTEVKKSFESLELELDKINERLDKLESKNSQEWVNHDPEEVNDLEGK